MKLRKFNESSRWGAIDKSSYDISFIGDIFNELEDEGCPVSLGYELIETFIDGSTAGIPFYEPLYKVKFYKGHSFSIGDIQNGDTDQHEELIQAVFDRIRASFDIHIHKHDLTTFASGGSGKYSYSCFLKCEDVTETIVKRYLDLFMNPPEDIDKDTTRRVFNAMKRIRNGHLRRI